MNRRRNLLSGNDQPDHESVETDEVHFEDDTGQTSPAAHTEAEEVEWEEYHEAELVENEEDHTARRSATWVVPALLVLAAAAWTAFFAFVHRDAMLGRATPAQWLEWIVQWSVPLVLLIGLYLVAMRNSRREANRFVAAARALSDESVRLENRLHTVNRELALAREFIESQSRDLETLGRIASERLSKNADRLQDLIRDNSAQVESIGHVSESALGNMETLRDRLPVLTNSARDLTNQIGGAGATARDQVDELVAAFDRLNGIAQTNDRQVTQIGAKVDETITAFERKLSDLGDSAGERFMLLRTNSEELRRDLAAADEEVFDAIAGRSEALARQMKDNAAALREHEAEATEAMQARLGVLRSDAEELVASIRNGHTEAVERWRKAIDSLEDRMSRAIEDVVKLDESATTNARMRLVALNEEARKVEDRLNDTIARFEGDMAARREAADAAQDEALGELENRIAAFDHRIAERQQEHIEHIAGLAQRGDALAARFGALDGTLEQLGSRADETDGKVAEVASTLSERLAQSRALLEESGEFLSRLTDDSAHLLELIRSSAEHSQGPLSEALGTAQQRLSSFDGRAQDLHRLIEDVETRGSRIARQLDEARETGAASLEQVAALDDRLAKVAAEAETVAERASGELREAIEMLTNASATVLDDLRSQQGDALTELANDIANASGDRLGEAMRSKADDVIADLQSATRRASESGRETIRMLRDQLARINELAGNLEARVEHARERATQDVDSDFSRRSALITEALNSAAIDISKAFDTDIGDTEWSHYLRGDRGIFTRRAVRLLDKHEERQISAVYSEDAEFREVVNRYIHDFEAMLRTVLSTRGGNSLAITLLSSDMGKLYVALAQGIDRLRD
ncbi:ATPase [Aurantiacibacter poecillastricola]|uniref:ATPase n=1 Tax=Aurantiacibacter poecillastricola TaxID=3064385 RepID=UPI00273D7D7D|nr:ATPase [Aurantiacibacter sp. 219JJ12-13]MDP5262110.1 ATPase [Aurantiacibacter sp. 219JJ12-13]